MVVSALERHYKVFAAAVLVLAALNLGVRLGSEAVADWDEALFANNASEMAASGQWVATTLHDKLDYYNAKPPLNSWLVAGSFKIFGTNLVSLRLPSAIAAWLTVLVLMLWTRRCLSPAVSILSGAVLATNFGFVHVHAGRSADTDALLTLLVLLTVVILWAARDRPRPLVWLGPVFAATFLLKGMAVLLPIAMVFVVEVWRLREFWSRRRWLPLVVALPLFLLPVAAWAGLRWQIDGWKFLKTVAYDDFIGHTFRTLDGHAGSPFFYLNVLQKHEYLWLVTAVLALAVAPIPWMTVRGWLSRGRTLRTEAGLLVVWVAFTFGIPTLMGTKLPWYINPFYPVFAIIVGLTVTRGLALGATEGRRLAMGIAIGLAFLASESKLAWYSFHNRELNQSQQGLLLAEKSSMADRRVFAIHWNSAERFVIRGLIRGVAARVADVDDFLRQASPGDYLMWNCEVPHPSLTLVSTNGRHWLYRRIDAVAANK